VTSPRTQLSIFLAVNGFLAVFPMGAGWFRFMATDPDLNWSSRFRINSRHVDTLRRGRVFFGGDAAHVHSPAGGQGMNAGVQDVVNLSWKQAMVLRGHAVPALVDT